jgi:hypothetical protein
MGRSKILNSLKQFLGIILKAIMPPAVGLLICLVIIYLFPDLAEVTYLILVMVIFTLAQSLIRFK